MLRGLREKKERESKGGGKKRIGLRNKGVAKVHAAQSLVAACVCVCMCARVDVSVFDAKIRVIRIFTNITRNIDKMKDLHVGWLL